MDGELDDHAGVAMADHLAECDPIHVANFRAWNDPYIIGPVKKNEKLLVHVGSIGESPKVFHLHGHHFWRLWQMWHPWQPVPAWTPSQGSPVYSEAEAGFDPNPFTPTAELMHAKLMGAGEIMPILLKAGEPGFWFGHDHIVPQAYLGMVPWLHVTE